MSEQRGFCSNPLFLIAILGFAHFLACGAPETQTQIQTQQNVVVVTQQQVQVVQPQNVEGPAKQLEPEVDEGAEPPCSAPTQGQPQGGVPLPVQIEADGERSCTVHYDGRLCCWGKKLSSWWSTDINRLQPVLIEGVTEVKQIALGKNHSCLRKSSGQVLCWGRNQQGQLGNGTKEHNGIPIQVLGMKSAADISTGEYHTCATNVDGTVRCWGLGHKNIPRRIDNLKNVMKLALAYNSGCALLQDKTFKCFHGRNMFMYRKAHKDAHGFETIKALRGLTDMALLSRENACVVKSGQIWCFGRNYGEGKVINRMSGQQMMVAKRFSKLDGVVELVSGGTHSCARKSDGTVWCWGKNKHGQLGDGTTVDRASPVKVVDLANAVDISTGPYHTCALRGDGKALCWGKNRHGQLGDGSTDESTIPTEVRW